MNLSDLTIGIATCGRYNNVKTLIKSIKHYTNIDYDITLLDNTSAFTDKNKPTWINKYVNKYISIDTPIGSSESNQILAEDCKTKYLMHIDDDLYQTTDSVGNMFNFINNKKDCDIVSCTWKDDIYKRELGAYYCIGTKGTENIFYKIDLYKDMLNDREYDSIVVDQVLKSMIVDTDIYNKGVYWDKNFVWKGDLEDFFLTCKKFNIKTYVLPNTFMIHNHTKYPYGSISLDFSSSGTKKYFKNKWGMEPLFPYIPYNNFGN